MVAPNGKRVAIVIRGGIRMSWFMINGKWVCSFCGGGGIRITDCCEEQRKYKEWKYEGEEE